MTSKRLRHSAAALVVAGLMAFSGCTSTFTAQPYTPGVGTNVDQGPVMVRAMVLVIDGDKAYLTGSIVSHEDDNLTGIQGKAQDGSFKDVADLTFTDAQIEVPTDKLVTLTDKQISTPVGDLKPGLTAQLTLNFEKAGAATLVVPVVDTKHPDYTTFNPSAAASGS